MTRNIRADAAAKIVIILLAGVAAFVLFLTVFFVAVVVTIPFMAS